MLTEREQELVLQCSRLVDDVNVEEVRGIVSQGIDWEKFLEYSYRNKVLFLAMNNIIQVLGEQVLPKSIMNLLTDSMKCNEIRNNIKISELEKISSDAEANGIKIVPVKGAYLIDAVYSDRRIRTTNDIDLLICKKDILAFHKIMVENGYSNDKYIRNKNIFEKRTMEEKMLYKLKMYNLLPYTKHVIDPMEFNVVFDCSHSLDFSLDSTPVEEMINKSFLDMNIRRLLPEHFFVHLCCHHYREASHTEWIRLGKDLNFIKFCDVRSFILKKMNQNQIQKAIAFAHKYKLEKAIYFTVYYLGRIYNDGYENAILNELNIEDTSFLFSYGENEYDEIQYRNKEFWCSFFDVDNMDEIHGRTKYDSILK